MEDKLKECTEKCDIDPNRGNLEELECLQTEYYQLYDYITQGAIIRSRATWYEMGEKNNKYILNLENSNKGESSVRKILTTDGALTSDPKKIINELELYYPNLYDGRNSADTQTISSFINDLTDVPYLAEEKKNVCEGILRYDECYNVLQTFQKNKSPGNDVLTAEFYL